MLPFLRAPLRHHVGVRLEEQGLPRTVALPYGPDVGPARGYFFGPHFEADVSQIVRNEPGSTTFVSILSVRAVDAGDAHEVCRQTHEFLAVDPTQYVLERTFEHGQSLNRQPRSDRCCASLRVVLWFVGSSWSRLEDGV